MSDRVVALGVGSGRDVADVSLQKWCSYGKVGRRGSEVSAAQNDTGSEKVLNLLGLRAQRLLPTEQQLKSTTKHSWLYHRQLDNIHVNV